jgi:ClpP class serine protease
MNRIPTALRIASSLLWAVTPEYLAIIEAIAAGQTDPVAVANQLGRPLENTRTVSYRDNVAIIPVHSVIVRRADLLSDLSGAAASVQTLALDFRQAEVNPAIDTIVFDFDSPGGEVNGIAELAQMIKRCQKRTVAYVGDTCASAAYWLATACNEIVMYKTASVGSVGVQAIASIARDPNRKVFTSKQSPDKNARADTERGATLIQKEVDKTAQIFIEDVAAMRSV